MKGKISRTVQLILAIIIPLMYGASYASLDFPQIFEAALIERFKVTAVEVVSLYSFNSITAPILNLVMVVYIEKVGIGLFGVLCQLCIVFGILMIYISLLTDKFLWIIVGRIMFGVGVECYYMVNGMMVEKWLPSSFVTLVIGFSKASTRFWNSGITFFFPMLYVWTGGALQAPVLGLLIIAVANLAGAIYTYLLELVYRKDTEILDSESVGGRLTEKINDDGKELEIKKLLEQESEKAKEEDLEQAKDVLDSAPEVPETPDNGSTEEQTENEQMVKFGFRHFTLVPNVIWVMILLCCLVVANYYQLVSIGTDFMMHRFSMTYLHATNIMSLFPAVNLIIFVACILYLNKVGNKTLCYILGSFLFLLGHTILALLPYSDPGILLYVVIFLLNLANSLIFSTLTASIMLSCPSKSTSLCLAVNAIGYNGSFALFSPITGWISASRSPEAYQHCIYYFIGSSVVSLLLSFYIYWYDRAKMGALLCKGAGDDWLEEYKTKVNKEVDDKLSEEYRKKRIEEQAAAMAGAPAQG